LQFQETKSTNTYRPKKSLPTNFFLEKIPLWTPRIIILLLIGNWMTMCSIKTDVKSMIRNHQQIFVQNTDGTATKAVLTDSNKRPEENLKNFVQLWFESAFTWKPGELRNAYGVTLPSPLAASLVALYPGFRESYIRELTNFYTKNGLSLERFSSQRLSTKVQVFKVLRVVKVSPSTDLPYGGYDVPVVVSQIIEEQGEPTKQLLLNATVRIEPTLLSPNSQLWGNPQSTVGQVMNKLQSHAVTVRLIQHF
jgi:hypothetical protein